MMKPLIQGLMKLMFLNHLSSTLEEFCLMLLGRKLILSDLLLGKKFRYKGGKAGALKALKNYETLELVPGSRVGSIKLNQSL